MVADASSPKTKPVLTPEMRAYLGAIGTGWRKWSKEKRSVLNTLNAKRRWALRRLRYGPSGQRDKPYDKWRKDRGYPPVNDHVIKDSES